MLPSSNFSCCHSSQSAGAWRECLSGIFGCRYLLAIAAQLQLRCCWHAWFSLSLCLVYICRYYNKNGDDSAPNFCSETQICFRSSVPSNLRVALWISVCGAEFVDGHDNLENTHGSFASSTAALLVQLCQLLSCFFPAATAATVPCAAYGHCRSRTPVLWADCELRLCRL